VFFAGNLWKAFSLGGYAANGVVKLVSWRVLEHKNLVSTSFFQQNNLCYMIKKRADTVFNLILT
jgi:hypothetical protein